MVGAPAQYSRVVGVPVKLYEVVWITVDSVKSEHIRSYHMGGAQITVTPIGWGF